MAGLVPTYGNVPAQTQSGVGQGAYAPAQISQVAQVQAPPDPAAYFAAVQAQFAPQFAQSQEQLSAQQQAMGTLTSGAGNYGDQQLTAQNNATLAGAEAPLIQQGFAQQFDANAANAGAANSAASQNANSTNAYLNALQGQYFTAGQNQINNGLQSQEFNANLLASLYGQDQAAQNALQLAKLGYGNSNYQQQVGIDAGFGAQGLGGALNTVNQGQYAQNSNYMGTQAANNPYAAAVGGAAGIPSATNPYGYVNGGQPTGAPTTSPWAGGSSGGNDGYYGSGGQGATGYGGSVPYPTEGP